MSFYAKPSGSGLLLTLPVLARMKRVEGWLEEDEADLLIAATARALQESSPSQTIVEVGTYCGRSTVVLGSVVQALQPEARVYAVDPHEGEVGALDQRVHKKGPTLERLQRNLAQAGLTETVEIIQKHSFEVVWEKPIRFLLIDGLHDYANVSRDFLHFEPWLVPNSYVAFHDYADYYPGVQAFVNELLASGAYCREACIRSMIVLRKRDSVEKGEQKNASFPCTPLPPTGEVPQVSASPRAVTTFPRVSCIMPTSDRRPFIPRAIDYFLRQDYPDRELVVVDDGTDPVVDLMPYDPRIRYVRLSARCNLGAKRNLACREASGEILVHWDDDDWNAPWRLRYQVEALLSTGADLCGLDRPLFYEPAADRSWQYIYTADSRPWLYGATLAYTRALWERQPFQDMSVGEDNNFVWKSRTTRMVALPDPSLQVALIHRGNTSPKRTSGPAWRRFDDQRVREILASDYAFYRELGSRPRL